LIEMVWCGSLALVETGLVSAGGVIGWRSVRDD
jgi:hypothetical protein